MRDAGRPAAGTSWHALLPWNTRFTIYLHTCIRVNSHATTPASGDSRILACGRTVPACSLGENPNRRRVEVEGTEVDRRGAGVSAGPGGTRLERLRLQPKHDKRFGHIGGAFRLDQRRRLRHDGQPRAGVGREVRRGEPRRHDLGQGRRLGRRHRRAHQQDRRLRRRLARDQGRGGVGRQGRRRRLRSRPRSPRTASSSS